MKKANKSKFIANVNREYLSVSETAFYTGISERLMRDFLKDPLYPIPHFRIGNGGRLIRIRKSDIDGWMESFKSTTDVNIDAIVNELMLK